MPPPDSKLDNPVTDAEKHAWCMRRSGQPATFIPAALYAMAEREGYYDMRCYVITKPIPLR